MVIIAAFVTDRTGTDSRGGKMKCTADISCARLYKECRTGSHVETLTQHRHDMRQRKQLAVSQYKSTITMEGLPMAAPATAG